MTALVPLTSNPAPSAGTLTETTWSRAWTARQMYHKRILTYFTRIQSFDKRGHNLSPEICNSVFCFNSSRWWHTVWVQELCEQGGGADGFSFPIPFFPVPNKPQRKTQCPTFRCKSTEKPCTQMLTRYEPTQTGGTTNVLAAPFGCIWVAFGQNTCLEEVVLVVPATKT